MSTLFSDNVMAISIINFSFYASVSPSGMSHLLTHAMEFMRELSFMKQYWGVQAAVYGGVAALSLLSGSWVTEKTSNHKDVDEKLCWFEFRKR